MQAYQVNADGYGYQSKTVNSTGFFWSRLTAGKFCEVQLSSHIREAVQRFTDNAEFNGGFYNTIRKYNALQNLKQFNALPPTQTLAELANQVLALEADMRAIVPSVKHMQHHQSKAQVNDIVWLCVRVRKQCKQAI